ncbi:DUF3189 family protein [Mesobacillus zeae]|uniref:DUF3189 family protein n=1 Tax=Mesobacillus zeae TaxID=1917180 RepID=A0A398B5C8_9BACI|nr:DUF3189 family protein [Mesobacillus zeae]RID85062.1 DUF3189 family protein [Mesobacillus zeae]
MIYIYHDFGGTHTTSLAAAHHLKIINDPKKIPEKAEILALPYFNKLNKDDAGKFILHGEDDEGNPVYTLGRRSSKLTIESLHHFSEILISRNQIGEKIILSNTSPVVPLAMTIGGFFSRGLGVDGIGVPLLIKGAQQCYGNILQLVNDTKKIAKESNFEIVKIDNKKYQA